MCTLVTFKFFKRSVNFSGGLKYNKNSSGDEITNVIFYDDFVHVEASAYAH